MKAKRLTALLLAIVVIVGIAAIPASAVSGVVCGVCYNLDGDGTKFTYRDTTSYGWEATSTWTVDSCPRLFSKHTHSNQRHRVFENCSKHGGIRDYYEYRSNYCPA